MTAKSKPRDLVTASTSLLARIDRDLAPPINWADVLVHPTQNRPLDSIGMDHPDAIDYCWLCLMYAPAHELQLNHIDLCFRCQEQWPHEPYMPTTDDTIHCANCETTVRQPGSDLCRYCAEHRIHGRPDPRHYQAPPRRVDLPHWPEPRTTAITVTPTDRNGNPLRGTTVVYHEPVVLVDYHEPEPRGCATRQLPPPPQEIQTNECTLYCLPQSWEECRTNVQTIEVHETRHTGERRSLRFQVAPPPGDITRGMPAHVLDVMRPALLEVNWSEHFEVPGALNFPTADEHALTRRLMALRHINDAITSAAYLREAWLALPPLTAPRGAIRFPNPESSNP